MGHHLMALHRDAIDPKILTLSYDGVLKVWQNRLSRPYFQVSRHGDVYRSQKLVAQTFKVDDKIVSARFPQFF